MAVEIIMLGIGATLLMDLWALARKRWFGVAALDYAWVGRWLGHLPRGRFRHDGIGRSAAVGGERALGWTAHYVIGVVFATLLLVVVGSDWVQAPTLWPALAFGIFSVAAPFFILQPGMGAGLAASKTPAPGKARLRSLVAHSVFGVGMYLSALLLAAVRAA